MAKVKQLVNVKQVLSAPDSGQQFPDSGYVTLPPRNFRTQASFREEMAANLSLGQPAAALMVISLGAGSFSNCPADYHINKCFYNVIWQRLILRSKVLIHISPTPTKALKKHKQAENYQGSTVSHSCLQQTLTDTYCFPGTASYAEYCLLPQSFHPRNSRRICKYAPGHIHTVFSL